MIWTVHTKRGPIVVREQIEPDDEPGILRVFEESNDYFEAVTGGPSGPGDVQSLFYSLPEGADLDDKRLLTMRADDQIIGVVDATLRYPTSRACTVGLFLITPAYRRRGVGAAVSGILLDLLRELQFDEVTASATEGWAPSSGFLQHLGFQIGDVQLASSGNRRTARNAAPVRRATLTLKP